MRYLNLGEILYIHDRIIRDSGGSHGIRNQGGLESALALPRQTFGGAELYPSIIDKTGVLCFSIIKNHPFVDGNKRVGHAAMETFLVMNGMEVSADVDEQEQIFLNLASSGMTREEFVLWLQNNVRRAGGRIKG
jgi:death on curing protein